jgi:hypothetical protein
MDAQAFIAALGRHRHPERDQIRRSCEREPESNPKGVKSMSYVDKGVAAVTPPESQQKWARVANFNE